MLFRSLLAQNRQADRDRVQYQEDREQTERLLANNDFLTREIAALRLALGEIATRDYMRGEIRSLLEDLAAMREDDEKSTEGAS